MAIRILGTYKERKMKKIASKRGNIALRMHFLASPLPASVLLGIKNNFRRVYARSAQYIHLVLKNRNFWPSDPQGG